MGADGRPPTPPAPGSCQRWRDRRDSYRPAGEVIRTADYDVAEIPDDTTAKRFVVDHHYSATYPAARWRFGLYRRAELVGVAVFSQPVNNASLTSVFPGSARDSVELGRFVLLDDVPANGETWTLARCFDLLRREGVVGVLSLSDPAPRTSTEGATVFPGHIGNIYQALNGVYLGRSRRRTLRLLPNGTVFSERAGSKIRQGHRGWRYAVDQLVAAGAERPPASMTAAQDLERWLAAWLPLVTRPLPHPGNHRYAWAVDRRARRHVLGVAEGAGALPYPKRGPSIFA